MLPCRFVPGGWAFLGGWSGLRRHRVAYYHRCSRGTAHRFSLSTHGARATVDRRTCKIGPVCTLCVLQVILMIPAPLPHDVIILDQYDAGEERDKESNLDRIVLG